MMTIDAEMMRMILTALGSAVIHSIWQGILIGVVAWVALRLMRSRSPQARYVVSCVSMGVFFMCFVAAFTVSIVNQSTDAGAVVIANSAEHIPSLTDRWFPVLAVFWLTGAAFMQLRLMRHWIGVRRLKHVGFSPVTPEWQQVFESLCKDLKIRSTVRLVQSSIAEVPMVVGWFSPMVLVPIAAFTALTEEQLRSILAHELAHIRRHDYLINCAQRMIESILFFHPVVWWLSRCATVEREFCCDDVAVHATHDALTYSRALLQLDIQRNPSHQLANAATGGSLMNRIKRMVGATDISTTKQTRTRTEWVCASLLTGGLILSAAGLTHAAIARSLDEASGTHLQTNSEDVAGDPIVEAEVQAEHYYQKLMAQLDAGLITEAEAEKHLAAMHTKLEAKLDALLSQQQKTELVERHLFEIQESLHKKLEAGLISKEDAHRKLLETQELAARVFYGLHTQHRAQNPVESRVQLMKVDEMKVRLHKLLEAGMITKEEAHRELIQLMETAQTTDHQGNPNVHADHGEALHADDRQIEIHQHMKELETKLHHLLDAGKISKADAHEHLLRAKAQLESLHHQAPVSVHEHDFQEEAIQHDFSDLQTKLELLFEKGNMTEDEARMYFDAAKIELAQEQAQMHALKEQDKQLKMSQYLHQQNLEANIKAMVESGELTDGEARMHLDAAKLELAHEHAELQATEEQAMNLVKSRLLHQKAMTAHLRAKVEAGEMSKEEAAHAIAKMKYELHSKHEGTTANRKMSLKQDRIKEHLLRIKAEFGALVDSGALSPDEAELALEAIATQVTKKLKH